MVFVARKDLAANSVDELIGLARKSADQPLTYGSVGIGSLYHLILENVQIQTGIKLAHVPYKGNAPLLQDIAGGQVDFAVLVYSAAMGALADQGRLKVIGQLGAQALGTAEEPADRQRGPGTEKLCVQDLDGLLGAEEHARRRRQPSACGHWQITAKPGGARASWPPRRRWRHHRWTLAESARFYEAETARYRAIAKQINLQPQ